MESIFLVAAIIAIVYFLAKFIEMRFITKNNKSFKVLIRDSLLVYGSAIVGNFVFDQFKTVQIGGKSLEAFTDTPGF